MRARGEHPFATRWNHNTHYYPLLAGRIPASASPVLDIGCGDGTFCHFVSRRNRRVVGIDSDPAVVRPSTAGTTLLVASAEALPLADESVAVVTMTMVLHHVDAELALAEAARVLAPGGLLLVLGYGQYGGWKDLPHELRDAVAHRVVSRRMQAWEPATAKAEPTLTWVQTRAMAAAALPGSTYRRLPMWRYLVEWTKPQPNL